MGVPVHPTPWEIPSTPPDAILSLNALYLRDPHPLATNLSIGAYCTDTNSPHEFRAVTRARALLASRPADHAYLPIAGLPALRPLAASLIYGPDLAVPARVALVHTVSGSCALRLALAFARRILAVRTILLSVPTWPNHAHIAAAEDLAIARYAYFNPTTRRPDVRAMLRDLRAAPPAAAVLLQPCAHNPSAADLSASEWSLVADAVLAARLVPVFDMAYQGLASGCVHADALPVRLFCRRGLPVLVAHTFSKNMGLYNSRVGTVSICLPPAPRAGDMLANAEAQLCALARAMYSTPPAEGARVAALVLGDAHLRAEWAQEVAEVAARLRRVRERLGEEMGWGAQGAGMFALLGVGEKGVERLRKMHHIYAVGDGRINLAGINERNVGRVVEALKEVIRYAERDEEEEEKGEEEEGEKEEENEGEEEERQKKQSGFDLNLYNEVKSSK